MVAIVLLLSFIGNKVIWTSAIVGGIGFGVFLDELGKFVTRDNNYLFQPTIALIYIIFLMLFFIFRYIESHSNLSRKEYLMNALRVLEEAVLNDMDKTEKRQFAALLKKADPDDEVTKQLTKLLENIDVIPANPNKIRKFLHLFSKYYKKLTESNLFVNGIIIFFILKTLLDIGFVYFFLFRYFADPTALFLSTPSPLIVVTWGQVISTTVASVFVVIGVISLKFSRSEAYFFFKQSLLVTIFLTLFFLFYKEQLNALTGLLFNVLLLIGIEYMITEERQIKNSEKAG